ncbi:MAG: O-antigen ligase family protein [Pseudomonadota bacterium]|nr:O-antigen ligase family protein [Pseudomonadota bacterium]
MKAEDSQSILVRPVFKRKKQSDGFPQIRDSYATTYIVITTLIMAYSGLFGAAPILVLYAIWFSHIKYKGTLTLRMTPDVFPALAYGALCVISTLWSDRPELSGKSSLEFLTMIICTVVIARTVRLDDFIKGSVIGLFLVLLVPFRSGHYSIDGLFGSKNVVGSFSEIGFFMTLIYLFATKGRAKRLIFCAVPLTLFAACLVYSKSATSYASLAGTLAISTVAYFLGKLPASSRMPMLIMTVFAVAMLAIAGFSYGWQDTGLNALGKDSSLTGRTFLWAQGIGFTLAHNPIVGVGYGAFWIPGRPLAEELWYKFDIFDRSGFHFHNLFINTFVELGICGLLLTVYLYIKTTAMSFRFLVNQGASNASIFFIGFSIMFVLRAMAEIDTNGPFGMGPLLFFSIMPRITEWGKKPAIEARPEPLNSLPRRAQQPHIRMRKP